MLQDIYRQMTCERNERLNSGILADVICEWPLRGLPFMTTAPRAGVKNGPVLRTNTPKNADEGGGGLKYPKFCGRRKWKPP